MSKKHADRSTHRPSSAGRAERRRADQRDEQRRKPAAPPERVTPPIPYPMDKVEQASIESFPASDAPGYGTGHA